MVGKNAFVTFESAKCASDAAMDGSSTPLMGKRLQCTLTPSNQYTPNPSFRGPSRCAAGPVVLPPPPRLPARLHESHRGCFPISTSVCLAFTPTSLTAAPAGGTATTRWRKRTACGARWRHGERRRRSGRRTKERLARRRRSARPRGGCCGTVGTVGETVTGAVHEAAATSATVIAAAVIAATATATMATGATRTAARTVRTTASVATGERGGRRSGARRAEAAAAGGSREALAAPAPATVGGATERTHVPVLVERRVLRSGKLIKQSSIPHPSPNCDRAVQLACYRVVAVSYVA